MSANTSKPALLLTGVILLCMAAASYAERADDPNPESTYQRRSNSGMGNARFQNNFNQQSGISRPSAHTPPPGWAKPDENAYYSAPSNPGFVDRWGLSKNFPLKLPNGGYDYQLFAFPSDKEIEVYQRKVGSNVPRTGTDYNENDFFRDHAPGARRHSRGARNRPK